MLTGPARVAQLLAQATEGIEDELKACKLLIKEQPEIVHKDDFMYYQAELRCAAILMNRAAVSMFDAEEIYNCGSCIQQAIIP